MTIGTVEFSASSAGLTSDSISIRGKFNVRVDVTGTIQVDLDRSFDGGATWELRKSYTSDTAEVLEEPESNVLYRFEHASGGGSAECRLSF